MALFTVLLLLQFSLVDRQVTYTTTVLAAKTCVGCGTKNFFLEARLVREQAGGTWGVVNSFCHFSAA